MPKINALVVLSLSFGGSACVAPDRPASRDGDAVHDDAGPAPGDGELIGPHVGMGEDPKPSPVNVAEGDAIAVHLAGQPMVLDGVIDPAEWLGAATITFVAGDDVAVTGRFIRTPSHLWVAYLIEDATPEGREKLRFIIDIANDGGGENELKADDLMYYLQRGDAENYNPSVDFTDHAWDVYRGAGGIWEPLGRTLAFDFAVVDEPSFWAAELAIPLEQLDYQGEPERIYRSMSFVANAGFGHGAWPLDTFLVQPDSWGLLTITNP